LAGLIRAEDSADTDFQPGDALYAPQDLTPAATDNSATSQASFYSTAKLSVMDFAHPGKNLDGADLFIDGKYVGKSPVELSGYLIDKPMVSISATLDGYREAIRPAVKLPADGEAQIAMLGDNAVSWYTTPSFILGLLMLGGAVVSYAQDSSQSSSLGLGLVCGGVGVIALSQIVARFFHLPALERSVQALNAKPEPIP
jgi:hypothetical protein